jgi:hypothetical protein
VCNGWHIPGEIKGHARSTEVNADDRKNKKSSKQENRKKQHTFLDISVERPADPVIEEDDRQED